MIDTRTFNPGCSRWEDIFNQLKRSGFDVYSPGIKVGDCINPYVVVAIGSSTEHTSFSSSVDLYYIMCYVPKQEYSKLEPFVRSVEKSMAELEPMILPYGQMQSSFYDDTIKAHMVSITYKNYKKQGGNSNG